MKKIFVLAFIASMISFAVSAATVTRTVSSFSTGHGVSKVSVCNSFQCSVPYTLGEGMTYGHPFTGIKTVVIWYGGEPMYFNGADVAPIGFYALLTSSGGHHVAIARTGLDQFSYYCID